MSEQQRIVLSTSDEAASFKTVTGWVSRHGRFFGADERAARYDGSTHSPCDTCGEPTDRSWIKCKACREKADLARFLARQSKPYESGMVFADAYDRYFHDLDEAVEWAEDEGLELETLRLLLCDPVYPRMLDDDHWQDELPEDCTLADVAPDLAEAIGKANDVIAQMRKDHKPMSWTPSKYAVDLSARTVVIPGKAPEIYVLPEGSPR